MSIRSQSAASVADCGGWFAEYREFEADFQQAFAEPMPMVVAVALMTDTDDTGGAAIAWYGGIKLHLYSGETVALPFGDAPR